MEGGSLLHEVPLLSTQSDHLAQAVKANTSKAKHMQSLGKDITSWINVLTVRNRQMWFWALLLSKLNMTFSRGPNNGLFAGVLLA